VNEQLRNTQPDVAGSSECEGAARRDGSRSVDTLLEALPYIREFHGRTVVIKYGGAAMSHHELREELARDLVLLKYVGLNPIVVHGGGPEITDYMERLGLPVQFVGGLRVSDPQTVEVAKMVLVGKVNKEIVARLNRHGQPAVGLCGDDGMLFGVSRRAGPAGEDIGFVGGIERVNVDVIEHVARDYIPVIASVGADREGNSHNVNADEAAGAVARALSAYKVVFLTDVPGWLRDPGDPASLIATAGVEEVRAALGSLEGGMRPKLEACLHAIDGGVSSAHIIDGRVPHSLLLELFTDAGVGTKVQAE
jgi:acetylglutamate kinase